MGNEDILEEEVDEDGETLEEKQKRVRPGETTRANTREELKERLQAKLEQLRGGKKEDGDKESGASTRRRRSQEENLEPEERDEFEFNEAEDEAPAARPKSPKSLKKKSSKGKTKTKEPRGPGPDSPVKTSKVTVDDSSLFQTYRQGGGLDTDTDTGNDEGHQGSRGWCSSQ